METDISQCFKYQSYMNDINCELTEKMSISLDSEKDSDLIRLSNIDGILYTQTNQEINKFLFNKIYKTDNYSFLQLIGRIDEFDSYLMYEISNYDCKRIITNIHISSLISDSKYFTCGRIEDASSSSGSPYILGYLDKIEIWIDPYLTYDDDKVILFDNIDFHLDYLYLNKINNAYFVKNEVLIKFGYNTPKCKIIYPIFNNESNNYYLYMVDKRDKIINQIIHQ